MNHDRILADLAIHGVFSRREAVAAGVPRYVLTRWTSRGRLEVLLPGVFAIAGVPATKRRDLVAAQRWSGPASAASHRSAAALWDVDGFELDLIELTTARSVRSPSRDIVVHHVSELPVGHVRYRDGIPVTVPERTLFDLAALCSAPRVDMAIDDVLRRGLTTMDRLRSFVIDHGLPGRGGTRVMKELLAEREASYVPFGSSFEKRLRKLIRTSGLPQPVKQHRVPVRSHKRYLDFAYPERKVGIEALGYAYHSDRRDWERDQERHNELTMLGWRIVYVTYARLKNRPELVIEEIEQTLALSA